MFELRGGKWESTHTGTGVQSFDRNLKPTNWELDCKTAKMMERFSHTTGLLKPVPHWVARRLSDVID